MKHKRWCSQLASKIMWTFSLQPQTISSFGVTFYNSHGMFDRAITSLGHRRRRKIIVELVP